MRRESEVQSPKTEESGDVPQVVQMAWGESIKNATTKTSYPKYSI